MKTSALFIAALFGAVSVVAVDERIPECAVPCYEDAVPKAGCDIDDVGCQCDPEFLNKLQPIIMPCMLKNCDSKEIGDSIKAANEICKDYEAGKLEGKDTGSDADADEDPATTAAVAASGSPNKPTATPSTEDKEGEEENPAAQQVSMTLAPSAPSAPTNVHHHGNGTVGFVTSSGTDSKPKPTETNNEGPNFPGAAVAVGPAAGVFGLAVAAGIALL